MNKAIGRRGLQGRAGTYDGPGFFLGHVRLPIQGLDPRFDQPYGRRDGVFVFNGEIFNFKGLMPFAESDVEVLASYWAESRERSLHCFDGFWSMIDYDFNSGKLTAVTDDLGKKPLYIHLPTLSISSEIKALCLLDKEPMADELYFSSVAKWGYHIGDRTFQKTVRKLPAASVIEIDIENHHFETRPWIIHRAQPADVRMALTRSVENRLVSDVPISLLVSGGLDSAIIYKLVESRTHDFTVFHVDNGEEEFLNMLNIPGSVRVEKVSPSAVDIEDPLFFNEGPVDLGSMIPQYALGAAIKERCPDTPVVLTGDGADELFGGYRRMKEYDAQHSDIFEELVHYHLPRLDKLSMAHTLELRSPFLNRQVLSAALALPYEERIEKRHLKRCFGYMVPKAIIDRPKHPLKSTQVLQGGTEWRHNLIKIFREDVMPAYFPEG